MGSRHGWELIEDVREAKIVPRKGTEDTTVTPRTNVFYALFLYSRLLLAC